MHLKTIRTVRQYMINLLLVDEGDGTGYNSRYSDWYYGKNVSSLN